MDAGLHKKLLLDLQKSGFASEMRTIKAVRDAGWNSSGSGIYFDRDQSITRTIDITAFKAIHNFRTGISFEYHLFVEVKKTERPWVVFRESEPTDTFGDAWDNPYVSHNECISLGELTPFLREHSIRSKIGWVGYGVHEAFKDPQDTGRWYAAAVTTCKGSLRLCSSRIVHVLKEVRAGHNLSHYDSPGRRHRWVAVD